MKIKEIALKNIGIFEDASFTFPSNHEGENGTDIHVFTGPNGSGKTTLLLALSYAFLATYEKAATRPDTNAALLKKRLRRIEAASLSIRTQEGSDFFDFTNLNPSKLSKIKQFIDCKDHLLGYYRQVTLQFAVFGYSGHRTPSNNTANEKNISGLFGAIDFFKDSNDSRFPYFLSWLSNNVNKRLLAQVKNKQEAQKRLSKTIEHIETLLSEITGRSIRFDMRIEPDLAVVINMDGQEIDFDVLPDGLRSLISWIGDLLMRLDMLPWVDNLPIFERRIILFLDEIEVHLHPAWQRKVLPLVQRLFKNAQIFVSTHSPFVVNSVDNAFIYKLTTEPIQHITEPLRSKTSDSIEAVLESVFDVNEDFGQETEAELDVFYQQRDALLRGESNDIEAFLAKARELSEKSAELNVIVRFEVKQLSKQLQKPLAL